VWYKRPVEEVTGGVILGTESKWVSVLLLFSVASGAYAVPTVSDGGSQYTICAASPYSLAQAIFRSELSRAAQPGSFWLAGIAAEFMKPPSDFTYLPAAPLEVKQLPAVPTALLMVLMGFICISLVKDRKAWWAVLAGLLWLGQSGFFVVPQLFSHLCGKKQIEQLSYPNVSGDAHKFEALFHLRGGYIDKKVFPSLRAIIPERYNLNLALNRLVSITRWHISFFPAFIFAQLPRGPPAPAG